MRLARFDAVDLLRAHLHTGRTHQIRVHLASIGHPVVGDDTYGGGGGRRLIAMPPKRHFLHAAWLRFRHPATGAPVELRSPLPPDLATALASAAGPDVSFTGTRPAGVLWLLSQTTILEQLAAARTLLFRVAGSVYGCDIDAVREIIP